MKNNTEGNKLTIPIIKALGFEKRITKDRDGDEVKIWSRKGVYIHEESWWLIELGEDENLLAVPISSYEEGEVEPDITFMFATCIRGDGGFKSGFSINTDSQLKNLVYSLTSDEIE